MQYTHSHSIFPRPINPHINMVEMNLALNDCAIGDLLCDLLWQLLCNSHIFIHHKEPHVIREIERLGKNKNGIIMAKSIRPFLLDWACKEYTNSSWLWGKNRPNRQFAILKNWFCRWHIQFTAFTVAQTYDISLSVHRKKIHWAKFNDIQTTSNEKCCTYHCKRIVSANNHLHTGASSISIFRAWFPFSRDFVWCKQFV